jgi:hypothetical protein
MAKVHGIHDIVLNPGVSGEEFEQFFTREMMAAPELSGVRLHLWKGDSGERAGQYAAVLEIDSVATRDRHFPTEDAVGEEAQQVFQAQQGLWERWGHLASVPDGERTIYTDYVAIGE